MPTPGIYTRISGWVKKVDPRRIRTSGMPSEPVSDVYYLERLVNTG